MLTPRTLADQPRPTCLRRDTTTLNLVSQAWRQLRYNLPGYKCVLVQLLGFEWIQIDSILSESQNTPAGRKHRKPFNQFLQASSGLLTKHAVWTLSSRWVSCSHIEGEAKLVRFPGMKGWLLKANQADPLLLSLWPLRPCSPTPMTPGAALLMLPLQFTT